MDNIVERICPKCKQEKLLSDFGKLKLGKMGRRATCKICFSEYQRLHTDKKRKRRQVLGYVYGLFDPGTDKCRYIGYTYRPRTRLQNHIAASRLHRNSEKMSQWINQLIHDGHKPQIKILECVLSTSDIKTREVYWAHRMITSGCDLLNAFNSLSKKRLDLGPVDEQLLILVEQYRQRRNLKSNAAAATELIARGFHTWSVEDAPNTGYFGGSKEAEELLMDLKEDHEGSESFDFIEWFIERIMPRWGGDRKSGQND